MEIMKKEIKENIEQLINNGNLQEAADLINEYENICNDDPEIISMKGIILIINGDYDGAIAVLKSGLYINGDNFDLLYNLADAYEMIGDMKSSVTMYNRALEKCGDNKQKDEIINIINEIKENNADIKLDGNKKIVFFHRSGMDSFLGDIINSLSLEYEVRKIEVTNYSQIDDGMEWADICWFEWCDELIAYGSKHKLASSKKIICRLHRYEALTEYPKQVNWCNVDRLIIVTEHLKKFLLAQIPEIEKQVKIVTINNGVDIDKYDLKERTNGYNLAYVGYLHSRKNPVLLLQIMSKLVSINKRYKLYIAGVFQDSLQEMYFNYQIHEMHLEQNIIYQGWQKDIPKWLNDKNYILSTSIHESFGYGIVEAMCRGIKPVIHNFLFAKEIWDEKYMFNTIDEAVTMITDGEYNSYDYRNSIEKKYSLREQMDKINKLINELKVEDKEKVDNSDYYSFPYLGEKINFYLPYPKDWIQSIIINNNCFYEQNMLEDIKERVGTNKVIVDIGANIGNHTVFFGKVCKAKKVFSFEPQKNIFRILSENIRVNKLDSIVTAYNKGIGQKHFYADVNVINSDNYGMSKLVSDDSGNVEVDSLDNILKNQVSRVDMIKIDVEGMEIEVLKGSLEIIEKYRPLIYIECETEEEFNAVTMVLSPFGYKAAYRFNATPTYLFLQ